MKIKTVLVVATICLAGVGFAGIKWKTPAYSLVARDMPLRQALDTFGVAQGMSVVMSDQVAGNLSGDFKDIAPQEFLDRISTTHNLIWYYDGTALYVYGAGEITSSLMELQYMREGNVILLLRELGLEDRRFPIRSASNGELILVSGPPRYVQLIAETIARADSLKRQRSFNEIDTRVFRLVNTWADDINLNVTGLESQLRIRGVAQLLEEIMRETNDGNSRDIVTNGAEKAEFGLADQLTAGVRPVIKPDNRLNAVIVRDSRMRMPMYERLIHDLDVPQKIVEIEVTSFDISKQDALDWQLSVKVQGTEKEHEGAAGMNAQNLVLPAALAGMGAAGAYSYLGEKTRVDASISALKSKGLARNVSRAAIVTLNNFTAEMTDKQSYHARVVGEKVASLEKVSAGTKLNVKPRIVEPPPGSTNVPRQVWLTMELEDGGFESVSVDAMPMTRQSTLLTQAAMYENDSILLGGYFRDIKEDGGWGIPYLRDIPWIGWIFGGATYKEETVQRLFILTPRVIDIAAYQSTTQSLIRVQALNQRDMSSVENLHEIIKRDDAARKDREEAIRETGEIMEERDEERLRRNRKERDFRREKRHEEQEKENEKWDKEFERVKGLKD